MLLEEIEKYKITSKKADITKKWYIYAEKSGDLGKSDFESDPATLYCSVSQLYLNSWPGAKGYWNSFRIVLAS